MKQRPVSLWRPRLAGLLKRRSIHRHVGAGTLLVLLALYLVDGWLGYTRAMVQIESRHDRMLERVTVSLLRSASASGDAAEGRRPALLVLSIASGGLAPPGVFSIRSVPAKGALQPFGIFCAQRPS